MSWTLAFNAKGQKGDAGLSVLTGSGAPTTAGATGQAYIDYTNAQLYSYQNGTWVQQRSLVGPIGLNGINGSFFTGTGAPTSSTYSGNGQAIYIQATGEVWTYTDPSKGWVDSGETLIGPPGLAGKDGQTIRGSQFYQGSGPPPSDTSSFSPTPVARDLYLDTASGTFYTFS